MGKTVIVTGGAGFIGSNFVFHMLKKYPDYRIVCLDKLTYAGNLSTLKGIMDKPNFRFVKLDICDRDGVYGLFDEETPDIVVNFAAESHVDRSIEDPAIFLQTNIIGTSVMMDACRKYGNVRYHQVSTDEVYVICRLTVLICSLQRRHRFIPVVHIVAVKQVQTYWCLRIIERMTCL